MCIIIVSGTPTLLASIIYLYYARMHNTMSTVEVCTYAYCVLLATSSQYAYELVDESIGTYAYQLVIGYMPTLVRARTAAIYELLYHVNFRQRKKKSKVKKGCHRVNEEASREEIADFAALLAQSICSASNLPASRQLWLRRKKKASSVRRLCCEFSQ